MTRMMETLESRQLFSVTTGFAVDTAAPTIDDSAPAPVVVAKPASPSSPVLFKACCTGTHIKEATITL